MRVLFVDDESYVLSGIRRSLRHRAREWEMVFLDNAVDALKAVDAKFFDVLS